MREHHDWIAETIADIDKELARPPITIDESLDEAIAMGRMSIREAEECREAYHKTLSGLPLKENTLEDSA